MHNVEHNPMPGPKKILECLMGFLGSLMVGNLGMILLAQLGAPERWSIYFTQFWRLAFAGLALFLFTKKRAWLSLGIGMAVLCLPLPLT